MDATTQQNDQKQQAQDQSNQKNSNKKNRLHSRAEDAAAWYTDLILQSGLADYSPVKGCMVIKPYGYAIWEGIQRDLDARLKELGSQNAYFPLLIPMSFLQREAEHVEGFAPELAIVTHAGGEKLEEPLAIRPTSETIMYEMYSKWIQSYRDLPMVMNQWNNVVRWEKRTYFFLRTTEFLWQEGHSVHSSHSEAQKMVLDALEAYSHVLQDLLAVPVVKGVKSESEKFAGAFQTTTLEALMPDGRALQAATSHDLGQNFSKAFNIAFQDQNGEMQHGWQTSFGLSTRVIGGLILTHSDDQGLVLPPNIAPTQVVILPVRSDDYRLVEYSETLAARLRSQGVRVQVDAREKLSLGYRINDAELKGIPLRMEIGNKEMAAAEIQFAVRHLREKRVLPMEKLEEGVMQLLAWIQSDLFDRAKKRMEENTHDVATFDEFQEVMQKSRGFVRAYWNEDSAGEAKIKELTKAGTRCVPLDEPESEGFDVLTGAPAKRRWLFAQSY